MRFRLPPKKAFPHKIIHKRLIDKDQWKDPVYDEPNEIEFVRFDASYDFRRSGNDASEKMPNALITMFDKYSGSLPDFKAEDQISWNGRDYTIGAVVPLYYVSADRVGYELEVV